MGDAETVETAREFDFYVKGFDAGLACARRTMAELVRAGISDADLREVVEELARQ